MVLDVSGVDVGLMGSENALGAKDPEGARGFLRQTAAESEILMRSSRKKFRSGVILYHRKWIRSGCSMMQRMFLLAIGGVTIRPGDIIVADGDGVIAVPRKIAKDVAKYAHRELFNDKNARRGKNTEKLGWELDESVVNNQEKFEG